MSLNIDPISARIEPDCPEKVGYLASRRKTPDILLIDGVDITANRLFGPPARTLTYVCIWEISVGAVKALLSVPDAAIIAAAGQGFRLNFADTLNAPAAEYLPPEPPDRM